jgi:hypothetical protein
MVYKTLGCWKLMVWVNVVIHTSGVAPISQREILRSLELIL